MLRGLRAIPRVGEPVAARELVRGDVVVDLVAFARLVVLGQRHVAHPERERREDDQQQRSPKSHQCIRCVTDTAKYTKKGTSSSASGARASRAPSQRARGADHQRDEHEKRQEVARLETSDDVIARGGPVDPDRGEHERHTHDEHDEQQATLQPAEWRWLVTIVLDRDEHEEDDGHSDQDVARVGDGRTYPQSPRIQSPN